jgi:hypothetical protein
MIAEGLKANRTLRRLHLVRRIYHYIVLEVYGGESGFQGFRVGCSFFLNEVRSLLLVCCRAEIVLEKLARR